MTRTLGLPFFALLLLLCNSVRAHAVDQLVPGDFANISLAITAALPGDRILITEDHLEADSVVVYKTLTIEKQNEGDDVSIQAGPGDPFALVIRADGVVINGIRLVGSANGSGIVSIEADAEEETVVLRTTATSFPARLLNSMRTPVSSSRRSP